MRTIGYIVKNNSESRKVQKYFFGKGGEWNIWGKTFYMIPIGKYGTLITLHNDNCMGWYQIKEFDKLELAYDLFDIRKFGEGKLKI